jgi:hypothetical protein
MIENITQGIPFPPPPPMMSTADVTAKAWGPIGPIIFFRNSPLLNNYSDLVKIPSPITGEW